MAILPGSQRSHGPSTRRRRRSSALGAVLFLAMAIVPLVPGAAHADTVSDENRFVELINEARTGAGLPALVVHPALVAAARSWATKMRAADAAAGSTGCLISHNPDLRTAVAAPWRKLGENVGCGDVDVDTLHDKFMNSPLHRANIMDPQFDTIGIGIVMNDRGIMFVTEQFMQLDNEATSTTTSLPSSLALVTPPNGPTTTSKPTSVALGAIPKSTSKVRKLRKVAAHS